MHLQFKSIYIERFRSFLGKTILDFDAAGPGLYFLKGKNNAALGSNGAGKSSILDALMWCLYGKTVQGLKNPDIIPWMGKGTTKVGIELIVDKKRHNITRTAAPNKITLDGSEVGQEYIDQLIAIPLEILPYTIIIGQKQPLFYDLTAGEKLKLFSEVLNLDRWELRSIHAGKIVLAMEREINSAEAELELHKTMQIQYTVDFNKAKEQSAVWEAGRAEELEETEDKVRLLRGQIAGVMPVRDGADLQLDRAATELKAIGPSLAKLTTQSIHLERDIRECEVVIGNLDLGICQSCGKPLTDKKDTKIKTKVNQDLIDDFTKALAKINIAIDAQKKAKQEFENDAEEARSVLDKLQPKIAEWQAELRAAEKSIHECGDVSNPYTEQVQTLRRRRDQCKVSIEQTEVSIKNKTEYCERARFWVKGFKDIKLLTIEEILQELEITTNGLLEQFGLLGWRITYDIERETKSGTIARGLNITVLSPANKQPVKWEVWSGGEGQRLRLIGTAALSSVLLNHVGVTTNVEFYDEPTESLSREGVQDLVELLAQRAKDTKKAVWFIDHHVIESSHFTQTVLVTKTKNGSTLTCE